MLDFKGPEHQETTCLSWKKSSYRVKIVSERKMNAAGMPGMHYCEMKWQRVIKCPGFDQSVLSFFKGEQISAFYFWLSPLHGPRKPGVFFIFFWRKKHPLKAARQCATLPISACGVNIWSKSNRQPCFNDVQHKATYFKHVQTFIFHMFFQFFQFHSLPVWQGHRPLHAAARLKCIPRILTRAHVRGKLRLALRWWGRLRQRNASGAIWKSRKRLENG